MKAISSAIGFFYGLRAATLSAADDEEVVGVSNKKCTLYLAKSTIENAGLGVFTGVPLEEGQLVGFGDPAIPIVDIDFHAGSSRKKEDYHWLIDEYVWKSAEAGPDMELEAEETSAFVTGLGSLPNCHFRLKNVEEDHLIYETAGIQRTDYGAGAFTPYHNRSTYTLTAVEAGGELFVNYGTNWFLSREADMGLIPLFESYPKANKFMESAQNLVDKISSAMCEAHSEHGASQSSLEEVMSDLWSMIKKSPYKSRPLSAIPVTYTVAKRAFEIGIQQTQLEQSIRSLDYLASHGKCLDIIQPTNSSIPHAGRGAVATKFIPKGGYISLSPLVHIPDRDVLTMFEEKYDPETDEEVRDLMNPTGHQLLLNYCFGHKMSSVLLCPYGPSVSYINHSSENTNAKIVWASDPVYHNANWLHEPVSFFDNVWHTGLAFEYVATKDINEGDEIFIDYGSEWEDAWMKHIQQWQPPEGAESYISPQQLNQNPLLPVMSHDEDDELIGGNIDAWCHFSLESIKEDSHVWQARDMTEDEFPVQRIIDQAQLSSDGTYIYTLELAITTNGKPKAYLVKNVPRKALSFYGKNYGSDIFIKGAFRHEMMIPDDMFPDAWKNVVT